METARPRKTSRSPRNPGRANPAGDNGRHDHGTRDKLLEIAGQVFAARGFDRATGKEICRRANANAAAINYHFGGMIELYAAVIQEAHNRLVSLDAMSAALLGQPDAAAKLRAVLELFVRAVTGPAASTWVMRVFSREMVSPSPQLRTANDRVKIPKMQIMKRIVGELMGLPEHHVAVARGCISVMAPFAMLMIADRSTLKRIFPNLGLTPADVSDLTNHMVRMALAGLPAAAGQR